MRPYEIVRFIRLSIYPTMTHTVHPLSVFWSSFLADPKTHRTLSGPAINATRWFLPWHADRWGHSCGSLLPDTGVGMEQVAILFDGMLVTYSYYWICSYHVYGVFWRCLSLSSKGLVLGWSRPNFCGQTNNAFRKQQINWPHGSVRQIVFHQK